MAYPGPQVAAALSPWSKGASPYGAAAVSPYGKGMVSPYAKGTVSPYGKGTVAPYGKGAATPYMGKAAPTIGGACTTAYGPVANVCQSSIPGVQMVPVSTVTPVTTVTPLPNTVAPQVAYGQTVPTGVAAYGKGAVPAATAPVAAAAAIAPVAKTAVPAVTVPWGGISTMSGAQGPWGASKQATTGIAPGIFTSEAALPLLW